MQIGEALAWLNANQGLVAWLSPLAIILVAFKALRRRYSRYSARRETIRRGSEVLDAAASELPKLAEAASSAGVQARHDLSVKAGAHLDAINLIERNAVDPILKSELISAAKGVRDFKQAVINWHGQDDCDTSQHDAGMAAIERVKLCADKFKGLR